jgi:hypothetical protein
MRIKKATDATLHLQAKRQARTIIHTPHHTTPHAPNLLLYSLALAGTSKLACYVIIAAVIVVMTSPTREDRF